ncbi:LEA type 2 family protein [Gilvimarinus polysaccharolyticus]|uniref:LEA type 2 family protein n=1 Tax=Gilvimarinus polysaccharolyticus TaxID=863921 RepID=UPI0006732F2F|nr:LEA type 2 family protein [Gilvimarinus polysaccharolyticus]
MAIIVRPLGFARLLSIISLLLLASCASLRPGFTPPQVNITGLRLLPAAAGELAPRLGLRLRVTNPNPDDLIITGMSYNLALQGYDLLNGVSANVPVLKAYSDTPLELELSANIVALVRLAHSLQRNGAGQVVAYEFSAKLDTGHYTPSIRLNESGEVKFESM